MALHTLSFTVLLFGRTKMSWTHHSPIHHLQFLPSFHVTTMFTPGIEALSRLGCQASGVEFLNAIYDTNNLPPCHMKLLVIGSVATKVLVEVWAMIGGLITSTADLVTLASYYCQWSSFTHSGDYGEYRYRRCPVYFYELGGKTFTAV